MKFSASCSHCGESVQWKVQKNIIVRDYPSLMYNAATGNIEPVRGCKDIYFVTNNRRGYEVYFAENNKCFLAAFVTCPHCKKEFRVVRIIDTPMTYQVRFRKIITEMQADWQRYNNFVLKVSKSPDEKRIEEICYYFHGDNRADPSGVNVRDDLDPVTANKKLDELEFLLAKLEWR